MPAALVTGASKGIGAAVAKRLAKDGFDIAVHYNTDAAGAKRTAAAIRRLGRQVVLIQADLASPQGVEALAKQCRTAFARLQVIIHNAGFYDRRPFAALDEAAWRAYASAKAGLESLTRSLALELAPRVRVNAVAPGFVDTAILAGDSPAKRRERVAQVPLGRLGTADDVARAVSFLAGPDSAYVTGTVLAVNGGLRMG